MKFEKYFDHTILKADATLAEVDKICKEALENGFASVCVNEYYAAHVAEKLRGSEVKTCVVVGFPLGASTGKVKAFEAKEAIACGAQEIDMVINVGALKDGRADVVKADMQEVREACKGVTMKVIIETCLLTEEEKKQACRLAVEVGADFVKTSTGFSTAGAKTTDVRLMKEIVGDNAKVKASGGIRDLQTAKAMIEAGADRLGTSATVSIVKGIQ